MDKPKLLDLFCGAGGCSTGYYRAGFDVTGVDIKPQPHYPFKFIQADALTFPLEGYDCYHASPPCQHYSAMTKGRWQDRLDSHPELIVPTRERLIASGKPYVLENVAGAVKELINPILLCGTMFGLQTKAGSQLRRHRYFELPWYNALTPPCAHGRSSVIGVYGDGQNPNRKRVPATVGVWGHAGGSSNRDCLTQFGTQDRKDAMGIDWMVGSELSESIPPAYTEFIGKYLMKEVLHRQGIIQE
jgi:DNA (cytosine-5)-methyltransferase 1